jgi:seryl-tRNA synthetase
MSFQDNIKKWVALDNQLKTVNERVKQMRDEKNTVEECLTKCITNPDQVGKIMKVIKESREVKYVADIKRYGN